MSRLIKILHLDPDYQTTYFILRPRSSIRTSVPLRTAVALLKNEDFDLIISEPHNKAILKREHHSVNSSPFRPVELPNPEAGRGDPEEVWPNQYS